MDDNAKQISSYQLDQEILDARGINMTVEEVAGLPTCKYAERVQSLKLTVDDHAFLKGLRRRIKNRLASQNSRRRSMEHLRRLTRELRAVRACRRDALTERRALMMQRDAVRGGCERLRLHLVKVLRSRSDPTEVPSIDLERLSSESQLTPKENPIKKVTVTETKTPIKSECFRDQKIERDKTVFECSLEKLVQNSVNHIYKEKFDKKKIFAKTVFISNEYDSDVKSTVYISNEYNSDVKSTVYISNEYNSDVKSMVLNGGYAEGVAEVEGEGGVLNLSVKPEKRRSHGRKQPAPRRIACAFDDDGVLDLKIKKDSQ